MLLYVHEVLLLLLFVLEGVDIPSDLVLELFLSLVYVLSDLLLELSALHLLEHLLFLLGPLSFLPLGSDLHVTLACVQDVASAFLSFIELLPSLY